MKTQVETMMTARRPWADYQREGESEKHGNSAADIEYMQKPRVCIGTSCLECKRRTCLHDIPKNKNVLNSVMIEKRIKEMHTTKYDLANKLGVSQRSFDGNMNGNTCKAALLSKLESALGIPAEKLIIKKPRKRD